MNVNDFVNMAAGGIIGGPIRESTPWVMNRKRDVEQANISKSSAEGEPKLQRGHDLDGSYIDILQGNLGTNTFNAQMQDLGLVPPVQLLTAPANMTVSGSGQRGEPQYTLPNATLTNMTNPLGQAAIGNNVGVMPLYRPQQPITVKPTDIPSFHFEPFQAETEPELDSTLANSPAVLALKTWFKQELATQLTKAMGSYMFTVTQKLTAIITRELAIRDAMIDQLIRISNANAALIKQLLVRIDKVEKTNTDKPVGGRVLNHRDNVLIIDGLKEGASNSENDLVKDVVNMLNEKFAAMELELTNRDVVRAIRLGKQGGDRPRPVKASLQSDWLKKDLMHQKMTLKGTDIYLKDNLPKDLRQLQGIAKKAQKAGEIYFYLMRRDHILIVPYKDAEGVMVYDHNGLMAVLASNKVLIEKLRADANLFDTLPKRKKSKNKAQKKRSDGVDEPAQREPLNVIPGGTDLLSGRRPGEKVTNNDDNGSPPAAGDAANGNKHDDKILNYAKKVSMMTPQMMALFEQFLASHNLKDDEDPVDMENEG